MPITLDAPLIDSIPAITGFGFQSNGIVGSSAKYPAGVPGRMEVQNGAMRVYLVEGEYAADGVRSEMYFPLEPAGERWHVWEFMLRSDEWINDHPIAVMQIHDSPNKSSPEYLPRYPNLAVFVRDGVLMPLVPAATLPTQSTASRRVTQRPFEFDVWHRMCFHVNWKTDSSGFRELYYDGQVVFREWRVPTAYDDPSGPYLKLGLYNFTGFAGFQHRTGYFRNIRQWSGNDGYQSVMGTTPRPPHRLLQL